ncbi:MAG: Gfo/Idh/MocA family oxidoreductase [Chloroflexi bacterium]|nr:Gfo/Idh/MocA family oxidoreductase [Chloroflexota bacterium]MCY3937782.1 Gfo/Idh/MocA family oxidoreductase [Chloroflexota bacterium]
MVDLSDIRVAVVGVGHWHAVIDARYVDHLLDLGTQLVAMSDPDPAIGESRSNLFEAPSYTDFREMLAETEPDFVVALGKHSDMAETGGYLVDTGYPFMMEKPMAMSAEELRPVVERAEAKGAFIAVPYAIRRSQFARRATEMVKRGEFGAISHTQFRMIRPTPQRYIDCGSEWMLGSEHSGGGCLRNLGGHAFDIFRSIAGPEVEVVAAEMSSVVHGLPVEDYAIVTLRAGDVIGTVEAGCNYPVDGTDGEWRIAGSEAHLIWSGDELIETRVGKDPVVTPVDESGAYRDAVREILSAWKEGRPPLATARDCLLADELIDASYKMALGSLPA